MAALALPALDALATRLLSALAVAVGGEVAIDAARKNAKDAEEAKATPIAKTDAGTKKPCQKCPPDAGSTMTRKCDVSEDWVSYQARICNTVIGHDYIEEWAWLDGEWDGLQSTECNLQEAKANYDQFLGDNGKPALPFHLVIFKKMLAQASKKAVRVHANPPARLTYYFQTPRASAYMRISLSALGITVLYVP